MRKLRNIAVTQYRLFAPDLIPYRMIATPRGAGVIEKVMGFHGTERHQEIDQLIFRDGSFQMEENGPLIVIPEMHINERRVIISVEGNSEAGDKAYAMLRGIFVRLGDRFGDAEPRLMTEETRSVVELDFEWSSLLNPDVVEFAGDFIAGHAVGLAQQYIKTMSVQIVIGGQLSEELAGSGITVADKALVIEPRIDVPLSERVYFVRSPSDSETHLALVRDLEARLIKKSAKAAKRPANR